MLRRTLLPALAASGAQLQTLVTVKGLNGTIQGIKQGFVNTTTNLEKALEDNLINTIMIATQHDTHAPLTIKALMAANMSLLRNH